MKKSKEKGTFGGGLELKKENIIMNVKTASDIIYYTYREIFDKAGLDYEDVHNRVLFDAHVFLMSHEENDLLIYLLKKEMIRAKVLRNIIRSSVWDNIDNSKISKIYIDGDDPETIFSELESQNQEKE